MTHDGLVLDKIFVVVWKSKVINAGVNPVQSFCVLLGYFFEQSMTAGNHHVAPSFLRCRQKVHQTLNTVLARSANRMLIYVQPAITSVSFP